MKMNLPNALTILRICMIPFFVLFLMTPIGGAHGNIIAGVIFIAASLTDTLDGYLARKNNQITVFGKFMDPLADKLLVCSALICLVALNRMPYWIVIIIIGRDFIISGFRLIAAEKGVVIAANMWGKVKTAVQMVTVILLVFHFGGVFDKIETVLIWLALALTVISLVNYLWLNRKVLEEVH